MDFRAEETKAVLSKSLALIEKTRLVLRQLDRWQFPNASSEIGRRLFLDTLSTITESAHLSVMDPVVLYNRLFELQRLAGIIERSSIDRISWPLVGYCDQIWNELFGSDGPRLFYALTPEHNYSILPFSSQLARDLQGILPPSATKELLPTRELYCLQLAASENDNLPLYANIGHEFGHAVFDHHRNEVVTALSEKFGPFLGQLLSDLSAIDSTQANRRFQLTCCVLLSMGEELFCDLIGALLMGPAFFLSLFEMSWGQGKNVWTVSLSPKHDSIRAYPSFGFRMHCLRQWAGVETFCAEAGRNFPRLPLDDVRELASALGTVPVEHDTDTVNIWPTADNDAQAIRQVLNPRLIELKRALEQFLVECNSLARDWSPILRNSFASECDVAELLLRLSNDIPPNIIPDPDNPLLGQPATFTAILNASALFRLHLLVDGRVPNPDERLQRTAILERLTAKAFEATFIQREFNKWTDKK